MGRFIGLTASDGARIDAYRAAPMAQPKAGLVLVQEIFGLNRQIQRLCDRFAAEGYLVIAPAMQDRGMPGFRTDDHTPEAYARIRAFFATFRPETGLLDIAAAAKEAGAAGKVFITGFSFGGMMTWRAASAPGGLGFTAASGFYGGGVQDYIDLEPVIPTEMHYGDRDNGIPLEQIEDLALRHPDVAVYLYPAGHAFMNDDRLQTYEPASADLAFQRTLAFFASHLTP